MEGGGFLPVLELGAEIKDTIKKMGNKGVRIIFVFDLYNFHARAPFLTNNFHSGPGFSLYGSDYELCTKAAIVHLNIVTFVM